MPDHSTDCDCAYCEIAHEHQRGASLKALAAALAYLFTGLILGYLLSA